MIYPDQQENNIKHNLIQQTGTYTKSNQAQQDNKKKISKYICSSVFYYFKKIALLYQ